MQSRRPRTRLSDAYAASRGSISLLSFLASRIACFGKSIGDFIADAEEYLVGSLPWKAEWGITSFWLVIEITSSLGAAPTVVARCRETRDSKRRAERQHLPRPLDRSQENLLGVAIWKALVVESDPRYPKQGDQEANDRAEQSRSGLEPFDLGSQLGTIMGSVIARNHVGRAAMNPTSDGRTWDVQLWEEIAVSRFADCLLDSVVVGPSRVEMCHLARIGRRLREGAAARKCPVLSRRCNSNGSSPECHETQHGETYSLIASTKPLSLS